MAEYTFSDSLREVEAMTVVQAEEELKNILFADNDDETLGAVLVLEFCEKENPHDIFGREQKVLTRLFESEHWYGLALFLQSRVLMVGEVNFTSSVDPTVEYPMLWYILTRERSDECLMATFFLHMIDKYNDLFTEDSEEDKAFSFEVQALAPNKESDNSECALHIAANNFPAFFQTLCAKVNNYRAVFTLRSDGVSVFEECATNRESFTFALEKADLFDVLIRSDFEGERYYSQFFTGGYAINAEVLDLLGEKFEQNPALYSELAARCEDDRDREQLEHIRQFLLQREKDKVGAIEMAPNSLGDIVLSLLL